MKVRFIGMIEAAGSLESVVMIAHEDDRQGNDLPVSAMSMILRFCIVVLWQRALLAIVEFFYGI
jgi:hypothetical protein